MSSPYVMLISSSRIKMAKKVTELSLHIPARDFLQKSHKITSDLLSSLSIGKTKSRKLAKLRDTLLPKLLTGELNLDNIQVESDGP